MAGRLPRTPLASSPHLATIPAQQCRLHPDAQRPQPDKTKTPLISHTKKHLIPRPGGGAAHFAEGGRWVSVCASVVAGVPGKFVCGRTTLTSG